MMSRIPRWTLGCLALLSALIAGAALGVLLFAYGGARLLAVPTTARVVSYVVGLLFTLIGAFCIVAFARHTPASPPRSPRSTRSIAPGSDTQA
jgi:hypothetical protein